MSCQSAFFSVNHNHNILESPRLDFVTPSVSKHCPQTPPSTSFPLLWLPSWSTSPRMYLLATYHGYGWHCERSATNLPLFALGYVGYSVRLLTLHAESFNDRIKGTLRVVSLGDNHRYEALSCAWGESALERPPSILLNGHHELTVTDNLYNALRRLCRRFLPRTLWIDAICINQADVDERGHQVSMMRVVYS